MNIARENQTIYRERKRHNAGNITTVEVVTRRNSERRRKRRKKG